MTANELIKILLSDKPSENIIDNEEEIFSLIPELKICKGFNQNNEWHVYDVYNHILHVVGNVPSDVILRLTALFHDIGKPFTYTEDKNGVGHFYGHWEKSKKIFDDFAMRNNIDSYTSNLVSKLIYFHDLDVSTLENQEEILSNFDKDEIKMLFKIKKADLLSQSNKYHYLLKKYVDQETKVLSMTH